MEKDTFLSADLRNRFHGDFFGGGGGVVYLKGLKAIVCIPGWMKKFSFPFRRESEGRLQYSRIEYCNVRYNEQTRPDA